MFLTILRRYRPLQRRIFPQLVEIDNVRRELGLLLRFTRTLRYGRSSDPAIRVVIGMDVEYSKSKRAVFSRWRTELQGPSNDKAWVVEPMVAEQVVRNDDGEPNGEQSAGLCLRLEDFADEKTCQNFNDIYKDIFVSSSHLYHYLEEAEYITKRADFSQGHRTPRVKKRRRTQTPEEQLVDHDEDTYVQEEEHVS